MGLHVQLSSSQGEREAGQLEEKGRDLCQRPQIYPHREKGRQPDRKTQPTETEAETEKLKN